eukprot:4945101-Lingulodinium_polyedra.AAC.1
MREAQPIGQRLDAVRARLKRATTAFDLQQERAFVAKEKADLDLHALQKAQAEVEEAHCKVEEFAAQVAQ